MQDTTGQQSHSTAPPSPLESGPFKDWLQVMLRRSLHTVGKTILWCIVLSLKVTTVVWLFLWLDAAGAPPESLVAGFVIALSAPKGKELIRIFGAD